MFTHTFLDVNDYHRYHFPLSGTIKEISKIKKKALNEIFYNEKKGKYEDRYFEIDPTGFQFSQTLGYIILDTDYGLVAVIPVGMA